jgi:acyl transferase domain-containing protein
LDAYKEIKMAIKLAIVGMEAFFGTCHGLDNFEHSIYDATQHFIPIYPTRCQDLQQKQSTESELDFQNGKAPLGAYIKDFQIDAFRFKIPPNDLDKIDPKQLLLLKVVDSALRDAGLDQKGKPRLNVAVVAVIEENLVDEDEPRSETSNQLAQAIDDDSSLSEKKNIVFSKLANLWNISGPNFTVCVEENSVFEALETAKMLLTMEPVDAVVVGAVNLTSDSAGLPEGCYEQQSDRTASNNTGKPTLSYDCDVNGWMVGEGAGAVVLKRYERAKYDRDRIYATLDAVSLMYESTTSLAESVRQTCQKAFDKAGVNSTDIGYLEVFGSGVEQQDEAEIQGLIQAYQVPNPELSCAIGSVKANIGHTYVASGIASLIKTALCLYNRFIPATPQWSSPKNLEIWHNSPFYVATESRPWFLTEGLNNRVAAINSLGSDGTYAHAILSEDSNQKDRSNRYLEQAPFIFSLLLLTTNRVYSLNLMH